MNLQRTEGDMENPDNRITVLSRVVRFGPNGVGFEFVISTKRSIPNWLNISRATGKVGRRRAVPVGFTFAKKAEIEPAVPFVGAAVLYSPRVAGKLVSCVLPVR
jgi:hypothetical protein